MRKGSGTTMTKEGILIILFASAIFIFMGISILLLRNTKKKKVNKQLGLISIFISFFFLLLTIFYNYNIQKQPQVIPEVKTVKEEINKDLNKDKLSIDELVKDLNKAIEEFKKPGKQEKVTDYRDRVLGLDEHKLEDYVTKEAIDTLYLYGANNTEDNKKLFSQAFLSLIAQIEAQSGKINNVEQLAKLGNVAITLNKELGIAYVPSSVLGQGMSFLDITMVLTENGWKLDLYGLLRDIQLINSMATQQQQQTEATTNK